MKFSCQRDELTQAVLVASRLATPRATLPILKNIYLEVTKSQLRIMATDLEQTVEILVDGKVESTGQITVPARLLLDYLQHNLDQQLSLTVDDVTLTINSLNHTASLIGLPAEDYPVLPDDKAKIRFSLNQSLLRRAISRTIFAVSLSDTQPTLNGVLWRFKDKILTLVATDGYRLAHWQTPLSSEINGDYIIHYRAIQELERLITPNTQELEIIITQSQVKFVIANTTLTCRIIDGTFPAFEAILTNQKDQEVTVNSNELLQSLRLASLFSRDSAFSVKLTLEDARLKITAISPQLGENTNYLTLVSPSKPFSITCNAQYLIQALSGLQGDVNLGFTKNNGPIILTIKNELNYLYLLMPLRSDS